MTHFDCIVIGGGPAGSTAAFRLAERGCRTLLLEREAYPRVKPCGGLVSPQVQQWLGFDLSPVVSVLVEEVRYTYLDRRHDSCLGVPAPIVRREAFDAFLAAQARRAGAVVRDACPVEAMTPEPKGWTVEARGDHLHADYVVLACGSKSALPRTLGLPQPKRTVAAALEVEAPGGSEGPPRLWLEFGMLSLGYLWNFPRCDGMGIGGGVFRGPDARSLRRIVAEYVRGFGAEMDACPHHGHPVSLWNGKQRLHFHHGVLAGEAACVVDPLTAEGIRPSILTGLLAADAIEESLVKGIGALSSYSRAVDDRWGIDMAWASRLAKAFYRFPELGFEMLVRSESATRQFGRVLTGELRYREVAARALRRLVSIGVTDRGALG